MILDHLTLHNFSLFKGRQVLDLSPASPERPIILIGGLNGAGKTSILDALLLALYGKQAHVSNRNGKSYADFLLECITRAVPAEEGAAVELSFRHRSEGREDQYELQRSWAMRDGAIKERFEVRKNGRFDPLLSDSWDQWIDEILPRKLANLFFFDGEKIVDLADIQKSAAILSTSLHALLGLDLIDRLIGDLQILERRQRMALLPLGDRHRIEELERQIAELKAREEELNYKRGAAQNLYEQAERDLERSRTSYREKGGELHEQREALEAQLAQVLRDKREVEDSLRELATGSAPLLIVKDQLHTILNQAEDEGVLRRDSILATILATRDDAIFHELKRIRAAKDVQKAIQEFLANDRRRREPALRPEPFLDLSDEALEGLKDITSTGLPGIASTLAGFLEDWGARSGQQFEFERKINAVPDAEDIASLSIQMAKKQQEMSLAQQALQAFEGDLALIRREIDFKRRALTTELDKRLELDFQAEDLTRTLAHSERARATLLLFRQQVLQRNLDRLSELILECFHLLIRKRGFLEKIIIDPRTYAVALLKKDGTQLPMERLSAGERQLLALSLLWGLARATGRPIPTIIDTPLGRLDSKHRSKLVDRYFPVAAHQVIILSTDEEISAVHYARLQEAISRSYLLNFHDEDKLTTLELGYFWDGTAHGH